MVSIFATFSAVAMALNGLIWPIMLDSVLPARTDRNRSFSYEPEIGIKFLSFSENSIENSTLYYGLCENQKSEQNKCIVRRVWANFWGVSPKVDECNVTLRSDPGDNVRMSTIRITPLSKDRAIVTWFHGSHMRLSIINFSDCKVKTSKLSKDLDRLRKSTLLIFDWRLIKIDYFLTNLSYDYLKGEEYFDVFTFDEKNFNKSSVNTEGIVSKVDTWLYPTYLGHPAAIIPLSKDTGFLFLEVLYKMPWSPRRGFTIHSMNKLIVAHIQPNGQRQNLTREQVQNPVFSMANGLIGICGRHNYDTMKCTQFKLGDKEINWFSVIIVDEHEAPVIYNLPRGEGILSYMKYNTDNKPDFSSDRHLLKIGLDGKVKQFVKPDLQCQLGVAYNFRKIFEDSRGNYCTSFACRTYTPTSYERPMHHLKFQSNCFEPEDFKNPPISKQKIEKK